MVANTFETQGTILARGDGASTEQFTEIPGVSSINNAGVARALIDVTNLRSTSREFRLAIKEGKQMDMDIQYDPNNAQHKGLKTDADNDVIRNFRLTLTDQSPAQTWDFAALVMDWAITITIDSVYVLKVSLKPTGEIVITN